MKGSQAKRDQEADARPSVGSIDVPCADEQCDSTVKGTDIPDSEWQASMSKRFPTLCPECLARTPDRQLTPTQARKEYNHDITEFL